MFIKCNGSDGDPFLIRISDIVSVTSRLDSCTPCEIALGRNADFDKIYVADRTDIVIKKIQESMPDKKCVY
jgi:hypothetical protein